MNDHVLSRPTGNIFFFVFLTIVPLAVFVIYVNFEGLNK